MRGCEADIVGSPRPLVYSERVCLFHQDSRPMIPDSILTSVTDSNCGPELPYLLQLPPSAAASVLPVPPRPGTVMCLSSLLNPPPSRC